MGQFLPKARDMVRFAIGLGSDTHHLHRQWKSHQNRAQACVGVRPGVDPITLFFMDLRNDRLKALGLHVGDGVRNHLPGVPAVPGEAGIESGHMLR